MLTGLKPRPSEDADPMPSWNNAPTKQAIIRFVERVTRKNSPDFVPPQDRIVTFDDDGTLWAEQPMYFQFAFALDRVKALAPHHPEWNTTQPFASLLKGDLASALAGGGRVLTDIMTETHAGMTRDEFHATVQQWVRTARHPRFNRPYTECIYQPMLELLSYLRTRQFKTFIVSGGGAEFMRAWVTDVYGIPTEEVSIQRFIGRRPIAAFGNSDGDQQMIEWTTAGTGLRLALVIHHDSAAGTLNKAFNEAGEKGWTIVDMKTDWKTIFPK